MSELALDPALRGALRVLLAGVMGWAAAHKLRDPAAFRAALAAYALLPRRSVAPVAAGLVALEASIAAGLLWPGAGATPALCAAALLALYAGAIAVNLARGRRDIDCGCAGPAGGRPLHGSLLARNAVLVAAAALAALPASGRVLGALDAVTIAGAGVALMLVYAAADAALAQAPRLAALRAGPGEAHAGEVP